MKVNDYEYNEYAEGLVSQEKGEELIAQIEMRIKKDSIPHFEVLKIGKTDEEFEFLYNYLEEKGIVIRGINPTMEEIESFKKVSKLGINYYDLPEVIDSVSENQLFIELDNIRQDRINKGENPLKDDEYKKVRSQIANGHLRLAKYITTLKPFRNVNIEPDDLFAFAYTGLSDAIDKFDQTKGFKFSTYAWIAIYRRIERGIATEYGINQNKYLEYKELMDTKQLFFEETGKQPSIMDLKHMLGFGEKKIADLLRFDEMIINTDSLEENIYEEDVEKLIDIHSDSGKILDMGEDEYYEDGIIIENAAKNDVTEEQMVYTEPEVDILKEKIQEVLETLTPREAEVLRLRFGLKDGSPKTLEEIGKKFNVTKEVIRQNEAKALRKMRHPSRGKKIIDFL